MAARTGSLITTAEADSFCYDGKHIVFPFRRGQSLQASVLLTLEEISPHFPGFDGFDFQLGEFQS
jgi:hypothetical protein